MDAQTLIAKLQSDAADSLSTLCVETTLSTPLTTLFPPSTFHPNLRRILLAWLESASAVTLLTSVTEAVIAQLQSEGGTLKDVVPTALRHAAREVLGRPYTADRKVVLTIIDTAPTRDLVRQLLFDAVVAFGRKASAPVAQVARGLGSLAKLAGDTVKSRTGGLGTLMGAVSGEVERQLEKRAAEFVDAALAGVLGQLADVVSDPRRVAEAAELRIAFFDGMLQLTGPQLARELINLDLSGVVEIVRTGLKRHLATEESDAQLAAMSSFLFERLGHRSLGDVLTDLGLLEMARELASAQLAKRIRAVALTPEFSTWLSALLAS